MLYKLNIKGKIYAKEKSFRFWKLKILYTILAEDEFS